MASLETRCTHADGVTLVELCVTADRRERVRVENRLDGPVWPPRREGVPAAGWHDSGVTAVVAPGDRLVRGYASPAEPADPPAEIAEAAPDAGTDADTPAPREVVRSLGRATPPRDAIPTPDAARDDNATSPPERVSGDGPPPSVTEWLESVADRVADGERLASASSVTEASTAVDEIGGPEDVRALRAQLAADGETLRDVAARCERLAARVEAVDIPADALARLA